MGFGVLNGAPRSRGEGSGLVVIMARTGGFHTQMWALVVLLVAGASCRHACSDGGQGQCQRPG